MTEREIFYLMRRERSEFQPTLHDIPALLRELGRVEVWTVNGCFEVSKGVYTETHPSFLCAVCLLWLRDQGVISDEES